jgi:dihydrofolate synthase/folylpolyglutamate synthase
LLRLLGDPQLALRGVLIGGTNGKGSTQALVGAALRAGGVRVGQMPKPHLVSYRERIVLDGAPIAVSDFAALLERVNQAADEVERRSGALTEFELLTCAAFLWFAEQRVEACVVEVGIGGRLDATNAWQGGVSAITGVALDHTDVLGDTIAAIAREKAAIIKRGDCAAITGAQAEALAIIRRRAARVGVSLTEVEPFALVEAGWQGVTLRRPDGRILRVGLLGRHQAANAASAWAILDRLADCGMAEVDERVRAAAFASARWPGRLELLQAPAATGLPPAPRVLLDGAHNPDGMAALAVSLADLLPADPATARQGHPVLLSGVMANHWQPGMLDTLRAVVPDARLIATSVPETKRSMAPADLAAAWGTGARVVADPDAALDAALAEAGDGGLVIVCGSLYLVGHLRTVLIERGLSVA